MESATLFKRIESTDKRLIPTGAIVAIVFGTLAIIAVSIFCCCPCWKKGGARPKALQSESKGEDVGGEIGHTSDLDGDVAQELGGNGVHEVHAEEIPPPQYEKFGGVELSEKPGTDDLGSNEGAKEGTWSRYVRWRGLDGRAGDVDMK